MAIQGPVELGDRVKDKVSGFEGIAYGITQWMYGCRRVTVAPEETKDGKTIDSVCFDEPQLEILKKGIIKVDAKTQAQAPAPEPLRRTGGPPTKTIEGRSQRSKGR